MTYTLTHESEFIKRRALGQSLETISRDMKIARCTLTQWDHEYSDCIERTYHTLKKQIVSETVEQLRLDFVSRLQTISKELARIDEELQGRELSDLSTRDLYALKVKFLQMTQSMIADTPDKIKGVYHAPEDRDTDNDNEEQEQ